MPRSAAGNCYCSSGDAETLVSSFNNTLILDVSRACSGEKNFVCSLSVLAHSELVAYTLQRLGRIRLHFAFRAASDLGSLPGTDVRPFLKTESLQVVKRSADCEDHHPSDNGIIMREQFQLDLYCRTALLHETASRHWFWAKLTAPCRKPRKRYTCQQSLQIGSLLERLCGICANTWIKVGDSISTTCCHPMLSWERLNVSPAATYHLFSQSGTGVQLSKIHLQLQYKKIFSLCFQPQF